MGQVIFQDGLRDDSAEGGFHHLSSSTIRNKLARWRYKLTPGEFVWLLDIKLTCKWNINDYLSATLNIQLMISSQEVAVFLHDFGMGKSLATGREINYKCEETNNQTCQVAIEK